MTTTQQQRLPLSHILYQQLQTTYRLNSTGKNFQIWKNKLDFVLFDTKVKYVLTDPVPDEKTSQFSYRRFMNDDFTARHIILSVVHDDLHLAYQDQTSAKSLLDALTSFFANPDSQNRLFKRYSRYRMAENTHVNEHLIEMRVMVKELELAGCTFIRNMQVQVESLVKSLPVSWPEDVIYRLRVQCYDKDQKIISLDEMEEKVKDAWASLKKKSSGGGGGQGGKRYAYFDSETSEWSSRSRSYSTSPKRPRWSSAKTRSNKGHGRCSYES